MTSVAPLAALPAFAALTLAVIVAAGLRDLDFGHSKPYLNRVKLSRNRPWTASPFSGQLLNCSEDLFEASLYEHVEHSLDRRDLAVETIRHVEQVQ